LAPQLRSSGRRWCPPPGVRHPPPGHVQRPVPHGSPTTWDAHLVSRAVPWPTLVAALRASKSANDQVHGETGPPRDGRPPPPDLGTTDTSDSFGPGHDERHDQVGDGRDSSDIASNEPTLSARVHRRVGPGVPGDTATRLASTARAATWPGVVPERLAASGCILPWRPGSTSQPYHRPILELTTPGTRSAQTWTPDLVTGCPSTSWHAGASHTVQSRGAVRDGTWYPRGSPTTRDPRTLYVNGAQLAQATWGRSPRYQLPAHFARRPTGGPNHFFAGSLQ